MRKPAISRSSRSPPTLSPASATRHSLPAPTSSIRNRSSSSGSSRPCTRCLPRASNLGPFGAVLRPRASSQTTARTAEHTDTGEYDDPWQDCGSALPCNYGSVSRRLTSIDLQDKYDELVATYSAARLPNQP